MKARVGFIEDRSPISLVPFPRSKVRQHTHVHCPFFFTASVSRYPKRNTTSRPAGCLPPLAFLLRRQTPRLMQQRLIDDHRRPGPQSRHLVTEDPHAGRIRPVVEHGSKEINRLATDGLFDQEVICHEIDAIGHIIREARSRSDGFRKVLHDETESREELCEADADGAVAAADVHDGRVSEQRL